MTCFIFESIVYTHEDIKHPKKASPEDWHPANVVAALHIAGWSLRRLSVHHGLCPTALKNALARPWPKAERLIAEAIGDVTPWQLWPSRYNVSIDDDAVDANSASNNQVKRMQLQLVNKVTSQFYCGQNPAHYDNIGKLYNH